MSRIYCLMPFFLSILLMLSCGTASAQISIIPHGLGISLDENEAGDAELILINDYEDPVTFSFDYDLIEDDEDRRNGPRRDDAGDLLRQFNSPINNVGGMCFDGELLWGGSYGSHRIVAMTLEGEEVLNFQSNNAPLSMTFDGEIIWASSWSTPQIFTYDLEGNRIEQFNMNFGSISGMASDRDQFVFMNCNDERRIHVISIEDHQEVTAFEFRGAMADQDIWGIEWVPDHRDGQLWGNSVGHLYQAFVDDEWNVEAVSDFAWNTQYQHTEPAHDGENMWHGSWDANTWFMFDDGVSEFHMLTFDPEEGEIPGEDSIPVELFVTSDDVEPGAYNVLVSLETNRETVEFTIIVTIDTPSALVTCRVRDAENEETLENVTVDVDRYNIQRFTNRNGLCDFEELLTGEYEFTFTADDYLTLVEPYGIDGEGELMLSVDLLHADCTPSRNDINAALEQGESMQTEITISNEGNGPLTYTTEKRLLGDANAEPWELRHSFAVGEITQDARIQGAVFIDDLLYFAGGNDRNPVIYVINRDGELVNQFVQFGESSYGYKDLTWDGELIWGSGERNIFGFTTEGELVTSFIADVNPCTNITWDFDRQILWLSGTTTDISGYDREGNRVGGLSRQDLRVYGLAYWPDDPDGYQLYFYHRIAEIGDQILTKMNVDNGDTINVVILDPEAAGTPQGCFITNQYDIYSWVFMANVNDGGNDRLDIWQVDARKDWMDIEPEAGVIESEEEQEFVITLDATGLPEAIFRGVIAFKHDGVGSETDINITLEVGEGGGGEQGEEMNLVFSDGWNMVSAHVQPDPDDVVEIMRGLVEAEQLILMKNGAGRFYNPAFNFNNIPGWLVNEGYMVKVDGDAEMTISGNPVNPDDPLPLLEGWQMASYYPRRGIDAIVAFSGIVDVLLMAKDAHGRFYNPAFNFSNMGDLLPGQGYLVKVSEAVELIYNTEDELADSPAERYIQPHLLPILPPTAENMSLLVLADSDLQGEVGVYTDGRLVGSGVIQNGRCGIAVWGDDPTTSQVDGALKGEALEIQLHDENSFKNISFETVLGENYYVADDFSVIRVLDVTASPIQFGIVDAYPNPFNSSTSITINLPEASKVNFALFDLNGRAVVNIASGQFQAGTHTFTLDGSFLASGVYIGQLQASGKDYKRKLTLLK